MQPRHYLLYIEQNYSYAILRPLQKSIQERGDKVAWFLAGNEVNEKYLQEDEVRLTTVSQVKNYSPLAVFVTGNVVPDFFPGIKVTVFHGFDARKRANDDHFFIRNYFDLYCTQGPDTTKKYQQLAKKHKNFSVVETGWCKLDPLFDKNSTPPENKTPVILYSSTFTKNLTSAPTLLKTIEEISKNERFRWIITFHPKMNKLTVDAYKNIQHEKLSFIETDNILPLLLEADVMLCDTSSILQEFLILNKPVVTYNNRLPDDCMIDVKKPEGILPAIRTALTRPSERGEKIKEYADKLHPYRDGKSSERVLDAVDWFIDEGHKNLKSRSLDLIRKIKIRKKLKYYWF